MDPGHCPKKEISKSGAKSLLHWRETMLHRFKRGLGWCKRFVGDLCSLSPKRPFAPSPDPVGDCPYPGKFPDPRLPNTTTAAKIIAKHTFRKEMFWRKKFRKRCKCKAKSLACSLANRATPVTSAATLQRKSSAGLDFVIITKTITTVNRQIVL